MNYDDALAIAMQLSESERVMLAKALLKSLPKKRARKKVAKARLAKKQTQTASKSKGTPFLEKILSTHSTWVDEEYMNWKKTEKKILPSGKSKPKN